MFTKWNWNTKIYQCKQYLRDDKVSMNIPFEPLRRWSKDPKKIIPKMKLKNVLQNQNKKIQCKQYLRDDKASMNIPSKLSPKMI